MGRLLAVVIGELAAAGLTQRLAQPHWAALREDPVGVVQAPSGDLVVTAVHLAAWLSAWWLLVGTGHDLVAVAVDARRGRRVRGSRLAPAWVQHTVHRAVGTVLLMGVMAGPAAAATGAGPAQPVDVVQVVPPPVPIIGLPTTPVEAPDVAVTTDPRSSPQPEEAADGTASDTQRPAGSGATPMSNGAAPEGTAASGSGVAPGGTPGASSSTTAEDGAASGSTEPSGAVEGVHVVAGGENLWVIARHQLSAGGQVAPTDREVHAHWLQLIQINGDLLRSGDPDRIFPGERLRLPVVVAASTRAGASPAGITDAPTAPADAGDAP